MDWLKGNNTPGPNWKPLETVAEYRMLKIKKNVIHYHEEKNNKDSHDYNTAPYGGPVNTDPIIKSPLI